MASENLKNLKLYFFLFFNKSLIKKINFNSISKLNFKVEYRNKSFSKFKYFFKKKYREGFLKYNLIRSENEIEKITIIVNYVPFA